MSRKKSYAIHQHYVKSFDGTQIGYQVVGDGDEPFVLCNGLGGNVLAWEPLYARHGDRFRFIVWDYRGIFSSDPPKNPDDLTIDHHLQDALAVLKKEKVKKAIFAGWSMGVQVCLEICKQKPTLFRAMALINGTFGNPFATAFNLPLGAFLLPKLNHWVSKILPSLEPHLRFAANIVLDGDGFIKLVTKLKLIHENVDSRIFRDVAKAMIGTNLSKFHDILSHLGKHTTWEALPGIKVPVLLIAGSRDFLTPVKVAEQMAERIPNSELFVIPQGSHYCLIEFPDILNRRLDQFLEEHGLMEKIK